MARLIASPEKFKARDGQGDLNGVFLLALERALAEQTKARGNDLEHEVPGLEDADVDEIVSLVADGNEIEGYPAFIVLSNGQVNTQVPAYLPGAPTTWGAWPDTNHPVTDFGPSHKVIGTDARGSHLPGSVIKQLVDDGYDVRSAPETRRTRPVVPEP